MFISFVEKGFEQILEMHILYFMIITAVSSGLSEVIAAFGDDFLQSNITGVIKIAGAVS